MLYCNSCGLQLPSETAYCPRCGTATTAYYSNIGTAPNTPTVPASPNVVTQPPPTSYGSPPYQTTPQNPYGTPPPTLYNPYQSLPLTPPPLTIPRRSNRLGLIIVAALLVLLLIGGGVLVLLSRSGFQTASSSATRTVNTTVNTAATATAHAQATATAAVQNPYTHSGMLLFADPLSDNSQGHNWDVNSNCAFTGGAYHAIAPDALYSDYCIPSAINSSDLAIEVQMQTIKGDGGGIVFRADTSTNKLYGFDVYQDGSYQLYREDNDTTFITLKKGSSPAITPGLNQTNLLAVVAQGSTLTVYVNHQQIASVTDPTYNHGQLGVEAAPKNHPTEVVFNNAKVWTL